MLNAYELKIEIFTSQKVEEKMFFSQMMRKKIPKKGKTRKISLIISYSKKIEVYNR